MTNAVLRGKLYAGNPHVRFDEGEDAPAATPNGFACACAKIATAGFAVLLCGAAMGADYHWTGAAGNHLWSTAGNWETSSGGAVASVETSKPHSYNFGKRNGTNVGWGGELVVTQDVPVVIGSALALNPATTAGETVTLVTASTGTMRFDGECGIYVQDYSRLVLNVDLSTDSSDKTINKFGTGELIFDLKAANKTLRNVRIKSGPFQIAATGAQPLIRVAFDTSATESTGGVFENDKSGMTLGGIFIGSLSGSWQSIGRVDMNGTMLNVGDDSNSTSTNFLPMPVFADGGKLTLQNERRMYLEGLPLGGTLAVDRADAQVVARRTAVRWLFEDAGNPLKDTVGAGERVLAPNGLPEVVSDPVRGKVLSISGGKYLKGPDANAGFAELQPQPTNNPYTVAFWFKPDSKCDDKGKIFYWGENANGKSAALRLHDDQAKGLMFTVWGNNRFLATAASPCDGSWHHFAVTYNGLTMFRIYYDGKQVDTFTSDIYYPPNKNFYVGSIHGGWVANGANPYKGLLDDFLIGSYELPAESIKKLVDDGLAATISAGSVEAKSAGEVAFAKKNANLARLSGNALAGGVTLQAEGTTLTVGADGTAGDDLFKGKIGGADAALVKEGADYALELSGPAAAVTNVIVKEGTLTLRRPLARKGLVVWYPFDENRDWGLDAGPARLPLFKEGAGMLSTVADGASGSALKFPGGTYIHSRTEFAPPSFPRGVAPYTISVWIRPTAEACDGTVPICCWGANSTRQLSMLRFDSTSSIVFTNWGAGDDAVATGLDSLCDGGWHHVVATYDGSTKKLYFDGVEKASKGNITLNVGAGSSIQLGHCSVGSRADQYYAGDMDEFMVLDYAWSAAETAAEYARRPAAAVAAESLLPEPAAHWTFDDEANPGADSSANGLTLTKSSGEVTLVEGEAICGKAARFSSASGFFKLDEFPSAIPSSSNAVTFIVRYRPDKTQNGTYYPGIVMWGDTAGWNVGKLVKISTEKDTPASIRLTIGGQNYAPGGFYRTDMGTERSRWITMVFVCSSKIDEAGKSCVKLYVDGEYVEQRESGVDVTAKEFSIGSNYAGTQNFYGLIDDVQIYDSALSSGQIRLIAEQLEASKGVAGGASAPASTLLREPPVAVASGATLRVASAERFAALSGAGTVEVSPLASLTVRDMRGFSGSLTGYGTVTVEKGATLDRSRVTVADTLTVRVIVVGMRIIIR